MPEAKGSPAFQRALPFVLERLLPAYSSLAPISFAYCQGSMVENLSNTSDVDVIFVWGSAVPHQDTRLPTGVGDSSPRPRVWANQETFHVAGQEYGVAHHTLAQWQSWVVELNEGRGTEGYPTPVIAAHGLLSGLLLSDPDGSGRKIQRALQSFPDRLRLSTLLRAREALPDTLIVLDACASQNDGLLFHAELVKAARQVWLAWFSAQRRYWPLEKRLTTRLRMMGRNDLACAEERLWGATSLDDKLGVFRNLAAALLAETPNESG